MHTLDDRLGMVRILGPVDVVSANGEPLEVGGHVERRLIAALAISPNRTIPSDQLSWILWGDDPPRSRDNTLQSHMSRLRRLLGHQRIRSAGHGYVLLVDRREVDALVFEELVGTAATRQTSPDECLATCNEALSLWRGVPFGEFADDEPFCFEETRLDELRLYTMEMRFASEIGLGREDMVVGALEALVQEYPYRERFWHLLIGALALGARRVEALRRYDDLRALLAEVGIEPLAEIRDLHRDILGDAGDIRASCASLPGNATRDRPSSVSGESGVGR